MTDFLLFHITRYGSIVLVLLLLVGCGGHQSEPSKQSNEADTPSDSMEKKEIQAPKSLAPNSAHITGTVKSVNQKTSESLSIKFQIDTILGYGPSTKPLTESESLSLSTTANFLQNYGMNPKPGDSLGLVISQTMTMGQDNNSTWRIVDIK